MTTELEGIHGSMRIERPAPRVVVLRIAGCDVGELGDAPFRAIERALPEDGGAAAVELFVDARESTGVTTDVSSSWAVWLVRHEAKLAQVRMLTRSRLVQVTADFVRRFADLTDKMHVHTDERAFDEALAASIARS